MKIGFIGFGNMAQAIADGLISSGTVEPCDIATCARDFEKLKTNAKIRGILPVGTSADVIRCSDTIFLAVKPYQVEAVIEPVRELLTENKVLISVVAGYDFDRLKQLFTPQTHYISTIPNTPVAKCQGIFVCENKHSLSDEQWNQTKLLLSRIGLVFPVDSGLLDTAGTICGCGPAFVAMFIEALADAAVKHGIPRHSAYQLVSQMVAGTAQLQLSTGKHPATMKDEVCSPSGTTIVGVAELERKGFRAALIDAIDAIKRKSSGK